MAKYLDFPTVYGKLGNHPGLLTTDQALDLHPITGRERAKRAQHRDTGRRGP